MAAAPTDAAVNVMVTGTGNGADPFMHLIDLQGAKVIVYLVMPEARIMLICLAHIAASVVLC